MIMAYSSDGVGDTIVATRIALRVYRNEKYER